MGIPSPLITPHRPKVFLDADVLLAGSAAPSEQRPSRQILRLSELALLEACTSYHVVAHIDATLAELLPDAIDNFHAILDRCLEVIPDPNPADLHRYAGLAEPGCLPQFVAALQAGCGWLVTSDVNGFKPGLPDVNVLAPGEFLLRLRSKIAHLTV